MKSFILTSCVFLSSFCQAEALPNLEVEGITEVINGVSHWRPEVPLFEGREHAGRLLGSRLLEQYGIDELKDAVVLGCPRGGLIFAKAIVDVLKEAGGNPVLDLVISRKILVPGTSDTGFGAVTEQGKEIYIERLVEYFNLDIESEPVKKSAAKTKEEVKRRIEAYRQGTPIVSLEGKVVIVADGVVSGGTMIACIESVREHAGGLEKRIIVATPVSTEKGKRTVVDLANLQSEDFCTGVKATPPAGVFWNSDDFYHRTKVFEQMTDQEVRDLLQRYREMGN